jgi:hypothetical protein
MAGFFMRGRMGGMKQFSIRDLLFLVVIVALALGWWLDRRPIPARFQLQVVESHACVLDTATGQVWERAFTAGYSSSDFLDSKVSR